MRRCSSACTLSYTRRTFTLFLFFLLLIQIPIYFHFYFNWLDKSINNNSSSSSSSAVGSIAKSLAVSLHGADEISDSHPSSFSFDKDDKFDNISMTASIGNIEVVDDDDEHDKKNLDESKQEGKSVLLISTITAQDVDSNEFKYVLQSWKSFQSEYEPVIFVYCNCTEDRVDGNIHIIRFSSFASVQQDKMKKLPFETINFVNWIKFANAIKDKAKIYKANNVLLVHDRLYTPLMKFSLSHIFKFDKFLMATGMNLMCYGHENHFISSSPLGKELEILSQDCIWKSVRKPDYLFFKLSSKEIKEKDIDFIKNKEDIIDLSPMWIPAELGYKDQDALGSMSQIEKGIRKIMINQDISNVILKACPSQKKQNIAILKGYHDDNLRSLYYFWNAGKGMWSSPNKRGLMYHSTLLGCLGFQQSLKVYNQVEMLSSYKNEALLSNARNHIEDDPLYDYISEFLFPHPKVSLNCKELHERCFLYENSILYIGNWKLLGRYYSLIDTILSGNSMHSKTIKNSNFSMCFVQTDAFAAHLKHAKTLAMQKKNFIPQLPTFVGSICDYYRNVVPDESTGAYQTHAIVNHVDEASNFLDFDHVYIASGNENQTSRYRSTPCNVTFDKKSDTIVFRGTPTGHITKFSCKSKRSCVRGSELEQATKALSSRVALVFWSTVHPQLLDAKFSSFGRLNDSELFSRKATRRMFTFDSIDADSYYCDYKYVVSSQGFGAAFRVIKHLKERQCLFLQHGDCFQWFYRYLKPWIHYVPFRADLSDLEKNIRIIQNTPGLGEAIAYNGYKFYQKYLAWDALIELTSLVLEKIIRVTDYPVGGCAKTFAYKEVIKFPH